MKLQSKLSIVVLIDICCIIVAHVAAYGFRFDWAPPQGMQVKIYGILPLLIPLKIVIFYMFGLYRGMYRYTSMIDLINILKAVIVSSGIAIILVVFSNHFVGLSRSVFILDEIFTFILLAGNRVAIRYAYQLRNNKKASLLAPKNKHTKHLLLVGAGDSAEKIIREIQNNRDLPYVIVGLVDDDPQKTNKEIHGHTIHGTIKDIKTVIKTSGAEELLITISAASSQEMQRIVQICRETDLPVKIMPPMGEIIAGKTALQSIREIDYRDLLGREKVSLDQDEIGKYLTGKTIVVTGAGGTIGSELCRQILRFDPGRIILLDAGEENLYNIEMEFRHELGFTNYVAVLGKIQNRELLNTLFCKYTPTVVFHAAAYKHVPMVETNPWEAIFNNVFAVRNLIETSICHNIERFVLVSTDKAVRPTNVMGATKRLTEILMQAYCLEHWKDVLNKNRSTQWRATCKNINLEPPGSQPHNTLFMAVRFGNVLGSSGSVIPLFKRQIANGGPVTVTDPEITRYFMSIDEAAQLILQAGAMGAGGEIFLLKMGEPIKITNLAKDLIKLMGLELDKDIKITYSGLRPGEKLYEELITEGEGIVPTPHEKIMVLQGNAQSYQEIEADLKELAAAAKSHNSRKIKHILQKIIPEYIPDMHTKSIVED